MVVLSKDIKLLTVSLILRTLPKDQQALVKAHFNPEVVKVLNQIEKETNIDVEKLDWTPFYQAWPELQRILSDCRREIEAQKKFKVAEEQRPRIREYILTKLGVQRKGPPVFFSQDISAIIDDFLTNLERI
jgi:hypothetical protein